MNTTQNVTEGAALMATKAAQPAAVSLATMAGYQVSELVLWAALLDNIDPAGVHHG